MTYQEIEVKYKLRKVAEVKNWLRKNTRFINEKHQTDIYLNPSHKQILSLKNKSDLFRIRLLDKGTGLVTFKHWYFKNKTATHCDEYEVKVDDVKIYQNILSLLDFKEVAQVDKNREIYQYKDFEISVDKVKKLGDYIEIEYKGKEKNVTKVISEIDGVVKRLGLLKEDKQERSYPILLLKKNETDRT